MKQKSAFTRPILFGAVILAITLVAFASSTVSTARQQKTAASEPHVITLEQATKYVGNFKSKPSTPKIKGAYFARSIFERLLAQPGIAGIRYYYAKKDDGTDALVMVAVDSSGNDLTSGVLSDDGTPCPPFCSSPNELNK